MIVNIRLALDCFRHQKKKKKQKLFTAERMRQFRPYYLNRKKKCTNYIIQVYVYLHNRFKQKLYSINENLF